jgi:DNA processing protein
LITSDFALEQGRDVFALPGKVDSDASFGPNALIQQGAKLVFSAEDIAQEYIIPEPVAGETKKVHEEVFIEETGDEASWVCSMLSKEPVSLDELVEKTNMDIPRISDILLKLRLKKLVKELPGKQFARCN